MNPRRGFLLIEASVSYVILALALVALAPLYAMTVKVNAKTQYVKVCTQLSEELLEEIRLRQWDQKTPSPAAYIVTGSTIGVDSGEIATNKTTFNDIDDFNGWTESPPKDPTMNSLGNFLNYSRSVSVFYVDSNDNAVAGPTDYKQVTVCTQYSRMTPICLNTLLTNR